MPSELIQLTLDRDSAEAQLNAADGQEGNKEHAAHAIDIASKSGADPNYIYSHYDTASRAYKTSLVQATVNRDLMVQDYFKNHPLASTVSKDDVSNLVTFSQAWQGLKDNWLTLPWKTMYAAAHTIRGGELVPDEALKVYARSFAHQLPGMATGIGAYALTGTVLGGGPWGTVAGVGAGILAGMGEGWLQGLLTQKFWPEEAERLREGEEQHPYAALLGGATAAAPFFTPGPLIGRGVVSTLPVRAFAGGLTAGITALEEALFKDEIEPRDIIVTAIGAALFAGKQTPLANLISSGRFVRTHILNGERPPPHVWRPWDEVLIEDTKRGMDQYDEVIKAANNSETKELSPEMWANFINDNKPIGLKWGMARSLYPEGSRPTPGDGLLGDVPGISEKWDRSSFNGEDIQIPFSDWSQVGKEVEKAMHDHVRLHPDLYTLDETKELPPQKDPIFIEDETQQTISDARTAAGLEPLFVELDAEGKLVFRPGVVMPKAVQEKMLKKIAEINAADTEKRTQVAKRKAERRLLPEFQRRAADHWNAANADVESSPEFTAWRFLNNAEFMGQKLGARPKIDPSFLSPEQLKEFPSHWLSENGLNPDEVGPAMGFKTGDDFINAMIEFRKQKGQLPYRQLLALKTQAEAKRRTEMELGVLEDLTTAEANAHVVAPREEDRVWIEYQTLGEMLNIKPPYDRDAVKAMAVEAVNRIEPHTEGTLIRYTRELGRAAANTSKAWAKGDILGAFQGMQETAHKLAMAIQIKAEEQRLRADNRILRPLTKVDPKGIDPEYVDWAQWIMIKHGMPTQRNPDHLMEQVSRPERATHNIIDFVNQHNIPIPDDPAKIGLPLGYEDYGITYNPNLPIWDKLLDPTFNKPVSLMSIRERKALTNSLRALKKLGQAKDGNELVIRDKSFNVNDLIPKFLAPIETFSDAAQPKSVVGKKITMAWRSSSAYVKTVETFLLRMARYDETGVWLTHFFDPANEAFNAFQVERREFAAQWRELWDPIFEKYKLNNRWWRKSVDEGPFRNPRFWQKDADGNDYIPDYGKARLRFTNENLVALAANMNSEDSIRHTAAGYGLTIDQLKQYAQLNLKEEHYELAQALGKILERLQDREDQMTMRRTNTVLERQAKGMVWTPFGERPSWYYPRKRDAELDDGRRGIVDHPPPIKIAAEDGWHEPRTGAVYPVQLSLETFEHDITARLRYIHMQPVLDIWNKLLSHKDIQNAIYRKFGIQYSRMLREYFNDLAANQAPPEPLTRNLHRVFNEASGRGLTNVIGYNLGTIQKHAPQSILQSIADDPIGVMKAALQLGTNRVLRWKNIEFMRNGGTVGNMDWKGTNELKNRRRYFKDDLSNTAAEMIGRASLLGKVDMANVRIGMFFLAEVDNFMSEATWLARYNREMDARMEALNQRSTGMSPAEYQQAIADEHVAANAMAERAVRLTHGSTAITAKPALLRSQDPLTYTMTRAMNFMNNILQRRYRMLGQTKDMLLGQSPRDVQTDLRQITRDFMIYFFLPTFLEDLADPICKEDDEWYACGAKYLAQGVAAPLPFVRDWVHAAITHGDVSSGFVWNGMKYGGQLIKDVGQAINDGEVNYGNLVEHGMDIYGLLRATPMAKLGGMVNYMFKLQSGEEQAPEDIHELMNIARHGRTQPSVHEEGRQRILPYMGLWPQ